MAQRKKINKTRRDVCCVLIALFFACSVYAPNELYAQQKQSQDEESLRGQQGERKQPEGESQAAVGGQANAEENKQPQEAKPVEIKKELTVPSTVLEIKRLESEKPVYSIELRNVEFGDLFRVIAHDYNLNILVDEAVEGKITASFTNISLEEALDGIAEIGSLLLEKKKNIIRVSPHLLTRNFVLHYIEAKKLLETQSSASSAQSSASTTTAAQPQSSSSATTKTNSIHDLLSSKGKILLGKQPNSITVIDSPPYVAKIENYLNAIDKRMTSQVFKLKYLKAQEVAGDSSSSATGTTGSSTSTSASSSTGTGG